jgi:putative transposase
MRKSRFTEVQITMALRQAEAGTPITDICRKLEISDTTFFRWKKRFGSLGVPELRELRQLHEENRKLKGLVADLTLDKQILQESLRNNGEPGAPARVGSVGGRGLSRVAASGEPRDGGGHLEPALPPPSAATGALTRAPARARRRARELRLPAPAHAAPARGLARESQKGVPPLHRRGAHPQAPPPEAAQECYRARPASRRRAADGALGDGLRARHAH